MKSYMQVATATMQSSIAQGDASSCSSSHPHQFSINPIVFGSFSIVLIYVRSFEVVLVIVFVPKIRKSVNQPTDCKPMPSKIEPMPKLEYSLKKRFGASETKLTLIVVFELVHRVFYVKERRKSVHSFSLCY
jgi:hypothetical protein